MTRAIHFARLSCWLFSSILLSVGCALNPRPAAVPTPVAFAAPPTLPEIIEVVNAHSLRVQQLHAENIRLTVPGQVGSLRARMDFERPNRFRLFGETRLTGPEIDLGSNDTSYWLWAKQVQPPTVFHGEHSQFFQSAARQVLPVPPNWLIEALGVVYLDPQGSHEIVAETNAGHLQIRSRMAGELLRLLEIDPRRGLVVVQHLYAADQQLLASAWASDFQYDPLQNVSLPRRIQAHLPPAGLSLSLEVPSYVVNQPAADALALFSLPQMDNHQYRNLANPSDMQGFVPFGGAPASAVPPAVSPGGSPYGVGPYGTGSYGTGPQGTGPQGTGSYGAGSQDSGIERTRPRDVTQTGPDRKPRAAWRRFRPFSLWR